MAEYIVSARKYRPMRFSEMVGQEQVATTLKNAIRTGQLAHSFLFCGPRGVGKTTAARILAKTINCENITPDFEACGKCQSCISFQQNASFNIHELDAASNNSVDDIRALVDQVRFPPQSGKYKIYIIDEVHMLSAGAFNAFLKTLEEPPPYCKFILATTEKHKILPTILSRCQIFDFKRISVETIVNHLRHICEVEKIDAEEDALHIIAQKADGGMRDALSMFDRLSGYAGGKLTYASVLENLNVLDYDYFFKVTDALLTENLSEALKLLDEVLKKGFEGDDFILGLCEHLRNLLFCKDNATVKMLEVSDSLRSRYAAQAILALPDFLVNCLNLGNQCDVQYRTSKNKRLTVELALIKMCYVNAAISLEPAKKKVTSEPPAEKQQSVNAGLPEAPSKNTQAAAQPVANQQSANKQPVILPKTKKLLTADSIDEVDKPAVGVNPEEEIYSGEVLVLNQENITRLWAEYAANVPDEKKGLKMVFDFCKPVLDENVLNHVVVTAGSDVQLTRLSEFKPGMQRFLSQRTGVDIELEIVVDKEANEGNRPFTPREKFEHIAGKNPAIRKMQQQFGLELDYD
ncbi:MAG TPA: DNA polymerase III subunit gamma/tau [Chitinophagales bacterium]|nr:DNA polymerase III subunit gamma/tau [Chitinophagales bacterium]